MKLHEGRHRYASLMIAAGVNAKTLSTFMGHSSIQVTHDLYGHLMPGSEDEAAALLDGYLARAVETDGASLSTPEVPNANPSCRGVRKLARVRVGVPWASVRQKRRSR